MLREPGRASDLNPVETTKIVEAVRFSDSFTGRVETLI